MVEHAPVPAPSEADELGRRLLAAALTLLGADGAQALTVRRVAEAAGTTTMAIYSRFGGKEQLVDEMFRHGFARLAGELARFERTEDTIADLITGAVVYRSVARENPNLYRLMFERPIAGFNPSVGAMLVALEAFHILVVGVERAVALGGLTVADARAAAFQLWACMHGQVSLEFAGMDQMDDPTRDVMYDATLRALLRGIDERG